MIQIYDHGSARMEPLYCARQILMAVLLLLLNVPAFGWGREGHETITRIAERHLTPKAQRNIARYLDGHTITYYAKWMDEYRSTPEYSYTDGWHVAPVNSDLVYADSLLTKKGNAIYGLELAVKALGDYRRLPDSLVALNIKFIIHLVADMHCPAHIKYESHEMKYNVYFEDAYHKPHKFYVHHVWDNEIIRVSRIWSPAEWAGEIDILPRSKVKEMAAGTPREWLHDNAVRCEVQFEWAAPDQRLGQDFLNKALPLVETQLLYAGYRLAGLLNGLLG